MIMPSVETYSERCRTSKMELFAKIVNDWKPQKGSKPVILRDRKCKRMVKDSTFALISKGIQIFGNLWSDSLLFCSSQPWNFHNIEIYHKCFTGTFPKYLDIFIVPSRVYLGPSLTNIMMELFAKIGNGWKSLTNFAKSSIINAWWIPKYTTTNNLWFYCSWCCCFCFHKVFIQNSSLKQSLSNHIFSEFSFILMFLTRLQQLLENMAKHWKRLIVADRQ